MPDQDTLLEILPDHPLENEYCCVSEEEAPLGRVCEEVLMKAYASCTHEESRTFLALAFYDVQALMMTLHGLVEQLVEDGDILQVTRTNLRLHS